MHPQTLLDHQVRLHLDALRADGDRQRLARELMAARSQQRRAALAQRWSSLMARLTPAQTQEPVCCV